MSENPLMFSMEAASLGYGRRIVLDDVNFSMQRGEVVALLGPNGAGKTTILRAILGEIKPKTGKVNFQDTIRFGYVPQLGAEGNFWPLKVKDFIRLFTRNDMGAVSAALDAVGISDLSQMCLQELSGGQRQKVLLSKALANKPDLLILDEPTHGMDIASEDDYLDLLRQLNHSGLSIVLVTHEVHIALSTAQKILIVEGGKTVTASIEALLNEPILEELYKRPFDSGRIGSTPVIIPVRRKENA